MTSDQRPNAAVEHAHAKVNLHLHVVGRRADGYHLLDSLVVFAAAHDTLRVRQWSAAVGDPVPDPVLRLTGPFGAALEGEAPGRNLVVCAAAAFAAHRGHSLPSLVFELEKRLPVASGIGGGSADAAAALRLLRRMLAPGLPDAILRAVAAELGADVPVCVTQVPALMGGIGERLSPAPAIPSCGLLLVNPGVAVSTPAVFRARDPGFTPAATLPARWVDAAAMADDLRELRNDLEPAAIALCPTIGVVLAAIRQQTGCLLARMSGSGATCFGLFAAPASAAAAAVSLEREGWWCSGGAPVEVACAAAPSCG